METIDWHQHFTYNPESGDLLWKERPVLKRQIAVWNMRFAGKVAGCKTWHRGGVPHQIAVVFHYKMRPTHRIIWEMHNGPIPKGILIDHEDGNPFNNRLSNLRQATNAQNLRNRGRQKNNTTGYKGVSISPWGYRVQINNRHVGYFKTLEEAATAYAAEADRLHGEFARTA